MVGDDRNSGPATTGLSVTLPAKNFGQERPAPHPLEFYIDGSAAVGFALPQRAIVRSPEKILS